MFDDEFVSISLGGFVRGKDYINKWVVFVVKSKEDREGDFGTQTIATVDFLDLSDDGNLQLQSNVRISDPNIVKSLIVGKKIVGKIEQLPPKKNGYKGAIIITQPHGPELERAIALAKSVLSGKPKNRPIDELEDLLG